MKTLALDTAIYNVIMKIVVSKIVISAWIKSIGFKRIAVVKTIIVLYCF